MNRRRFLRHAGLGGVAANAGCLGVFGGREGGRTVLDPPEDQRYDSSDLPYPAYGQEFPSFSLPDPLTDTTVNTAELDRTLVVTGFFASCPVECVQLIGQLAGVQQATIRDGIADEVTFLAITFDPERDDAPALREYARKMRVDLSAGNWHFLRPPNARRAKAVVQEKLGIQYERIGAGQSERLPGYDFRHLSLTFLRNPGGIVERAYNTAQPDHERVFGDVQRVVAATD